MFAGIIRVMAEVAAVLLDERPSLVHTDRIGGTAGRLAGGSFAR